MGFAVYTMSQSGNERLQMMSKLAQFTDVLVYKLGWLQVSSK